METETADVVCGLDVFGMDGEKLGTITEVYGDGTNVVIPSEGTARSSSEIPAAGGGHLYFKLHQSNLLGLGGTDLYVPLSAIADVAAGRCVTLSCDKDECSELYGAKPDFLV